MKLEQIIALAREYAEETDGSPVDIAYTTAIAENAIRFLLRRFCLVEKSKVEDLLQWCNESSEENEEASIVKNTLSILFGSKCLPDEKVSNPTPLVEPKSAEPKFKVGDKVRTMNVIPKQDIGRVGTVVINKDGLCNVRYNDNAGVWCDESDLEPYTEPFDTKDDTKELEFKAGDYAMMGGIKVKITGHDEHYPFMYEVFVPDWNSYTFVKASILKSNSESTDNPIPSNSTELNSQETDKHFDNILKDGSSKERRLNIAAMAMLGILSNKEATQYAINNFRCSDGTLNRYSGVAECSLAFADALITKSERGENDEN